MKRILSKANMKSIVIFLVFMFIITFAFAFVSSLFQKNINPLYTAIHCASSFVFVFGLFFIGFYLLFIVINFLSSKALQYSKFSKDDFTFSQRLFRDIIDNYSPALLAFVDNMQYDYNISIVANLLSLKNKNFLELNDENINIIKYDFYNLELSERFIIENIRNNKVDISPENLELKKLIIEEGKRKGLFEEKYDWINISKQLLVVFVVLFFIVLLSYFTYILLGKFFTIEDKNIISNALPLIFTIFICLYYINYQSNPYIRTKKSKDLNCKLEGLKIYLNKYGLLNEKGSKEILIWKDYLIYSVIFGHNDKIMKEYKKYYK